MQKNAAHTYAISSLLVLSLTGCAWIPSTPLVQGATSAQPVPGPTPVANGSIFQSAQPINYGYQPLFEDRRPRNIGDTLTIVLQENVSASKSSSANASRDGKTNFGFDTVPLKVLLALAPPFPLNVLPPEASTSARTLPNSPCK